MKLKKVSLILATLIMTFSISTPVFALEKEKIVYMNLNGVKLTETQYSNLKRAFGEDTISTLTQDMANILKDDTMLTTRGSEKYIQTDTTIDYFGNIISTTDTEVSKDVAINYDSGSLIQPMGYPVHQTTMKRLSINITVGSISVKTITVTCEWLSGQMPSTRSTDVIGIRPGTSFTLNTGSNITSYLKHNGVIVQSYSQGHSNIKSLLGGVGLSMPLPTGGTSMSHGLTIIVVAGADPFTAYGSFQHAQSAVTLADSKVYTISSSGLGSVINFTNSTTRAKYDAMQGVNCTWSTSTLDCR